MAGTWHITLSDEIADWYVSLNSKERAYADRAFARLEAVGPGLRMPHARSLGDGLYELRFICGGVERRITYVLAAGVVEMLTTFRKQRDRETHEVARARAAAARHSRGV